MHYLGSTREQFVGQSELLLQLKLHLYVVLHLQHGHSEQGPGGCRWRAAE